MEEQVAEGIKYPLRSLAQKNWESPKLVSDYESFGKICDELGHAPGYEELEIRTTVTE